MSNLLDKSSIVLTPTAYDNSKVLCVKPSDGSGDFDFSRNSAATRVNAQGLVENVQILSSNLVQNGDFSEQGAEQITNGDFATDSDWGKVNATISGGKGNLDSTSGTSLLFQSALVIGKTYKATLEVSNYNGLGTCALIISTGVIQQEFTSNGVKEFYFTHGGSNTNLTFRATSGGVFSITNISVKEVGQNWTFGGDWELVNGTAEIQSSTNSFLVQSNVVDLSVKTYKLQYEVVTTNGSNFRLAGGSSAFGTITLDSATIGVKTAYLTSNGTSRNLQFNQNAFRGSVTNISIIEITDDTNLPRINYEGFSYQDALGNELIDYSTFTSSSASWSLVGGLWVFDDTANGYLTTPSIAVVVGDTYKVVVDVTIASGNANFRYASSNNQTRLFNFTDFVDGLNTFTATVEGVDGIISRLFAAASLTDNPFTLNSISIKKINGQEVVPNSGCGSWLFEPQSTNLLPYSEDFSQWITGGDTTIESGYLAPDGTNNAYKVSGTTSSIILGASLLTTTTRSIYARTISGTGLANLCSFNGNSNNLFTITEQWQRFEVNSAISTGAVNFYGVDFRGGTTLSEIILWGANATNDQDYATSYIPTSGSTVTRNQDVCTNGGSLATINSTEGTLYAEIAALANDGTNRAIALSDGSTSNVVRFYYSTTDNRIVGNVKSGGTTFFNFNNVLSSATDFLKVAISYRLNEFKMYVNGTLVFTDTSGNTPIGLNELAFDNGAGNDKFFGKTKALAVWKEALSDSELQSLTTI